jgi:mono/diheme cytochrome c family protein
MNARRFLRCIAALGLAAALGACQQKNTADQAAATSSTSAVPTGVERFLLFPNPIGPGGAFETDSDAYASAYYRAIDPNNDKDTLDKWKTANGFGGGTGTEHLVVFKDEKDLGYGRRMTGRMNADGSIAFFVENYNVTSGSSADYSSSLNVEAAIARDTRWHVGTNAIEWSSATCVAGVDPSNCDPNARFAKFYNFSSADGTRQKFVNLDGRGMKAMPGPCITCHGGRGDPLTPADAGNGLPRFPLVENSVSRKRGDVQARMHGMNVGSFGYSAQTGYTRTDQEAKLKDFNQWMACTYPSPTPGATVTGSWGTCTRPTAGANEWQGTAFELIEAWYGGSGMPQGTFTDTYVPAGWGGNPSLYTDVVAPYCRTCHILRGTANQSDLDFTSLAKFQAYADRIKTHVFDRGNMPLALIVYDDFWESSAPQQLAQYLDTVLGSGTATSSSGAALKPGRPIADPGPDRMVRTGANAILSGENSLFATSYSWSLISGSATITNASSPIAIFEAASPGQSIVRLTVGNGSATNSKDVTITADDNFPDPLNIRFAQVKDVLQNVPHNGTTTCVSCHRSTAVVPPIPPVFYGTSLPRTLLNSPDFDRDGDGAVNATDDAWFVKAIRARANLTDIQASPLLRKPTGNSHNGGTLFNLSTPAGLRNYSLLYNWILAGMQPGGVAASALVNGALSPVTLTFSGAPPYSPGIPLDGSASIGATSYLWSVVSGPSGPTGALPTITNPTSISATLSPSAPPVLNVPNVGTYVIELLVSDGVSSDAVQRSITVNETSVVADFTPGAVGPPVNQSVSFSGNPLRGNITLTSTSSGSPVSCQWQVTGPANATLDGVPTPATVTKSCGSPATLDVPSGSIGGTYAVTLTATSNLGTSAPAVTHSLTVQSAGSGVVANAGANSTNPVTFTNPSTFFPFPGAFLAPDPAGIPESPAITLNGSASTGPGTLTYTWSIISQPGNATGAYVPTIANASAVSTTLTVRRTGVYTVQLFVSNGLPPGPSNTGTRTITVQVAAGNTFTLMKNTFVSRGCTTGGCHDGGTTTPSWEDEVHLGQTLHQRVFARVTASGLADPATSLIITCPSQGCAMSQQTGFHSSDTSSYTQFLNWIINGAPND